MSNSDYLEFRGKCKEMSEDLIRLNPTLKLVRGHYICPYWGEQPHWWTVDDMGIINDPTARQFPSKGMGHYVPFNGIVSCSQCGKEILESEADFESNYAFCSISCHMGFVGL